MRGRYGPLDKMDELLDEPLSKVKHELNHLYFGAGSIEERFLEFIKPGHGLKHFKIFFGSQLLSAIERGEQFIVWQKHLLNALKHLKLVNKKEEQSDKHYFVYNQICHWLKERYSFRSLPEVHAFLWYGNSSLWNFDYG